MKLEWEKISYIFQIPLRWFKEADRRLNIFGDNKMLRVDRNNPDGTFLTIDPDAVREALKITESAFAAFETPTATTGSIPSNHQNNANLTTTWTREGATKGVKVYLPTDSWDTGVRRILAWRLCEFDRYGCLQKIYAQTIQTDAVSVDQL